MSESHESDESGRSEESDNPLWNDRLLVGHHDVDQEHRSLFDLAYRLQQAKEAEATPEIIGGVLSALADYSLEHFAREEDLMRINKFPLCAEHIAQHYNFIKDLTLIVDDYERGRFDVLEECRAFVMEWLVTHITVDDMAFGDHLRSRLRPGPP